MKKVLFSIALFLSLPVLALAKGFSHTRIHHQPAPTPPPVVTTLTSTVPAAFQFGTFNGFGNTQVGTVSAFFIGDGDSFTEDYQGLKLSGPLWVYWESSYSATQIQNGSADSFLKQWATQMKSYGQPVYFAPLDEMNGNWSAYYGNTTAFKAAWIHVRSLFTSDTNVKFAYDPNVSYPSVPTSTLLAYYPGSGYVDIVGLDGFDFGGQTFAQVFNPSLSTMQSLGKPFWLTSVGVVNTDNQAQFLKDMFAAVSANNIQGVIYFDYENSATQNFVLGSSALSTLNTLLK